LTQNRNDRDRGTGGNVALSLVPDVTRDGAFTDDGRNFITECFDVNLSGLLATMTYNFRWHHDENGGTDRRNRTALYVNDRTVGSNLLFETASYHTTTTNFQAATDGSDNLLLRTGLHSAGRSIQ
jgi:hypothetical protein